MDFSRDFPEKEKLIDIGLLTVGFSKEFGQFFTGRFLVLGTDWILICFPGYWFLYQSTSDTKLNHYSSLYNCTIALFCSYGNYCIKRRVSYICIEK
jgi:hypothetical protein